MKRGRRPGLQDRWRYVVDSLESIIPIYERGSSRISLFFDEEMRRDVVRSTVTESGERVLDLGSGPGTLSRVVAAAGGVPILADASSKMLATAGEDFERVQCVFEHLPFRDGSFKGIVAGFAMRDSMDLKAALKEVRRILADGGRFGFCDLGKPDSYLKSVVLGYYIFTAVPVIGLLSGGKRGLGFSSLYQTYLLTLTNGQLVALLERDFSVSLTERQLGGAIVVSCSRQHSAAFK